MFTRLKTNIAQYPRLFTLWLMGCALTIPEAFVPRQYAEQVDVLLALILAAAIYQYVFRNAGRTRIALDMISRFEGRDVCTIDAHIPEVEEDGCTCDNEQGCLVHDKEEEEEGWHT